MNTCYLLLLMPLLSSITLAEHSAEESNDKLLQHFNSHSEVLSHSQKNISIKNQGVPFIPGQKRSDIGFKLDLNLKNGIYLNTTLYELEGGSIEGNLAVRITLPALSNSALYVKAGSATSKSTAIKMCRNLKPLGEWSLISLKTAHYLSKNYGALRYEFFSPFVLTWAQDAATSSETEALLISQSLDEPTMMSVTAAITNHYLKEPKSLEEELKKELETTKDLITRNLQEDKAEQRKYDAQLFVLNSIERSNAANRKARIEKQMAELRDVNAALYGVKNFIFLQKQKQAQENIDWWKTRLDALMKGADVFCVHGQQ